jgi:hypothetical protein
MLPSGNGRPMIVEAVSKLDFDLDDLIVTILKEHDEKYDARAGIRTAFGRPIEVVVLDKPTASQPETVSRTLALTGLSEPFFVKDSDNAFALTDLDRPHNYVSSESLNNFDSINPRNKSYIKTDETGVIVAIREKEVISDQFSVGGYFFRSPARYIATFEALLEEKATWQRELYTSDIIASMILGGEPFSSRQVSQYEDWGTLKEWRRNLQQKGTYFVMLDGFLMERGNAHFFPRFADVAPHEEAIAVTRDLIARGHEIVVLSIRPSSLRDLTEQQLQSMGLAASSIIFDMPIGRYSVVTAPHPTVPFTSAHGMELAPGDPHLATKMRFEN